MQRASGGGKGLASSGKAKAGVASIMRDDSSDEEQPPTKEQPPKQALRETAFLDKDAVLAAVLSIGQPTRLPSVMTDDIRKQWNEWHASVPTSLAEIPMERRATYNFAMPMKCLPPSAVVEAPAARTQIELMAYQNTAQGDVKGAGISKQDVQRNAEAQLRSQLVASDVPKGSSVAVKNASVGATSMLPVGERTPFLVGDVLEVELEELDTSSGSAAASASTGGPFVTRVLLHYRMPYAGEAASDDPKKPWFAACLCRQKYNKNHERFIVCRELCAKAEGSTSQALGTPKYVDWLPAHKIFETQLHFNQSQTLSMPTKKRICQADAEWIPLLGLKLEDAKKPRKLSRRA